MLQCFFRCPYIIVCANMIPPAAQSGNKLHQITRCLSTSSSTTNISKQELLPGEIKCAGKPPPEPPDNCCGTGCANCVWITYCDDLVEYYKDGGASALDAIKTIEDPVIQTFVKLEILNKMRMKKPSVSDDLVLSP